MAQKVEAVKKVLEQTNAEGTIRYEKTVISLNGLSTDEILDRLLDQRHP